MRIGATGLSDKGDADRTNLGAVDARIRFGQNTEVRAEAAFSSVPGQDSNAGAYIAEVEHRTGNLDLLAYARQVDANFGIGQQNVAERGPQKIGADARVRISDAISVRRQRMA